MVFVESVIVVVMKKKSLIIKINSTFVRTISFDGLHHQGHDY